MSKLHDLADHMRQLCDNNGVAYATLTGGLELVLSRADERWSLTLKRPDVFPSATEISIIRCAFGVPAEPGLRPFERHLPQPKTKHIALYRGYELTWRES
jgi:hypothetical protein